MFTSLPMTTLPYPVMCTLWALSLTCEVLYTTPFTKLDGDGGLGGGDGGGLGGSGLGGSGLGGSGLGGSGLGDGGLGGVGLGGEVVVNAEDGLLGTPGATSVTVGACVTATPVTGGRPAAVNAELSVCEKAGANSTAARTELVAVATVVLTVWTLNATTTPFCSSRLPAGAPVTAVIVTADAVTDRLWATVAANALCAACVKLATV